MNVQSWAATLSIVALAFSAVIYLLQDRKKIKQQEFKNYFKIMEMFSAPSGHWSSKVFLLYELEKYRNYKDSTIEILNNFDYMFRGPTQEIDIIRAVKDKVLKKL